MNKKNLILPALVVLSLAVLLLAPACGMKWINPLKVFSPEAGMDRDVLLNIRIPRVLTAYFAGAALALSGMTFQSIFRNPLATPFTLGVSSGAALGAAVYIRLGLLFSLCGISGLSLSAFVGALLSIGMVYGLTRLKGGFSTATLLLAGVAVSFFFSSLILFIQYISEFTQSAKMVRWMMGGVESDGYGPVCQLAVFTLAGSAALAFLTKELDLLMTGDDLARSRGVNAPRIKRLLFLIVSMMVGSVVAWCGPIGFVGMMVPHIGRLALGAGHRRLLPAVFLGGGIFLTACDTFARSLIPPAEIPTGIITALLGGPFFIALLLNKKGDLEL